jgi:integrase/recombinase XerD
MVWICDGNCGKDYKVATLKTLQEQIRGYYKEYKPKEWLFEGQYGGQYTVRCIQELLGHKSSKTTDSKRSGEPRSAIYTRVSQRLKQNVPNPLDQLGL